ncbi:MULTISPECIES: pyridoxal-dependent decarboxylase [unclassified Janthinobacterium]|uniref:pyridoxal-dependent decarboxylase n=1 Tax=unclassified Janthinobacterium TaxID=2610881 RepID=UPI00160D19E9|nr:MULTISPECIES: pyridoxal-dependent decarboxylase [unclassified Janthinobacterium]MBB5609938.1 glutamate decarboxylase [Janthinobacterium sp. S3T4]MBB5615042.1 glutamate decarboxylase [Janthinobacterium sp. S3M3]
MNDTAIEQLLQQHFSIDALQQAPAPLQQALRMLGGWLAAGRDTPYPHTPYAELIPQLSSIAPPAHGMAVTDFLQELDATVLANTAQLNHPRYIGHMTQALPWVSVLAEAFTAALNQNQVKIETAYVSTLIEKQILGWLHRQVYQHDDAVYTQAMAATSGALGNVVNGGTMGNLTALAVALEHHLPGTRKRGLFATMQESGYSGLAVIGSARSHYSAKKALATLGLGENALHLVPVDRDNRIDITALETTIAGLKARNIKVVAMIGIAGTTETGAIDPLAAMAAIAARENIWFHVDAAWGGALLIAEQFRPLYDGIALADSVVIDGHKLLWVPMAQSMVLFKDSASLNLLKHNANYILRDNSGDLGQTSLEGSRRFDTLKLWATFKVLGVSGYTTLLQQAATLSRQLQDLLAWQQDFELLTRSDTFILTYRYVPAHLRQRMAALLESGQIEAATALNQQLNTLTAKLQNRQKAEGHSFVSRTVLESTPYPGPTNVLRVVMSNVQTRPQHLQAILDEQRAIGQALVAELGL